MSTAALAGLQIRPVSLDCMSGVWADCLVDQLIAASGRDDDSAVAVLLLTLVFGAPAGMNVTLPRAIGAS